MVLWQGSLQDRYTQDISKTLDTSCLDKREKGIFILSFVELIRRDTAEFFPL